MVRAPDTSSNGFKLDNFRFTKDMSKVESAQKNGGRVEEAWLSCSECHNDIKLRKGQTNAWIVMLSGNKFRKAALYASCRLFLMLCL